MKKVKKYFLPAILILAACLRLLTLKKLMVFTPDEEYLAYIAQTLVKNFHVIWIGVSALGLDFYMGPFWIYTIYPFVALFHGDPLILGVMTSLLGVGTTYLLYLVGKKVFSEKIALVAALLYATSALLIFYDQQPYPPGVPFLSLLMLFSLLKAKENKWWWVVFSAAYGVVFHIHLSLFPIFFVGVAWLLMNRKKITKSTIVFSIAAFLATISPLIAFDYFHKASNITVVFRILETFGKNSNPINFSARLTNLIEAVGRVFYLYPGRSSTDEILYPCIVNPLSTTSKLSLVFCLVLFIAFLSFFTKKKLWKNDNKKLLLFYSLAFLVPFIFMKIFNPIEYYLLGFFPIFILIVTAVLLGLSKKYKIIVCILIAFFVLHGVYTVFEANGDFGLATKRVIVDKVLNVIGDNPYELSEDGECEGYGGFRYIFSVYGRKPVRSFEDKTFAWLWPDEVSKTPPVYSVLITETRANVSVKSGYQDKMVTGGFTTYIYSYVYKNR